LLLARYNDEVIAGVVLRFFPGGVVEHAANSSLQSALHLKPNDLLHWRAIEWACADGLTNTAWVAPTISNESSEARSCQQLAIAWTSPCFVNIQSAIGWPTGSRRSDHSSRNK